MLVGLGVGGVVRVFCLLVPAPWVLENGVAVFFFFVRIICQCLSLLRCS